MTHAETLKAGMYPGTGQRIRRFFRMLLEVIGEARRMHLEARQRYPFMEG